MIVLLNWTLDQIIKVLGPGVRQVYEAIRHTQHRVTKFFRELRL